MCILRPPLTRSGVVRVMEWWERKGEKEGGRVSDWVCERGRDGVMSVCSQCKWHLSSSDRLSLSASNGILLGIFSLHLSLLYSLGLTLRLFYLFFLSLLLFLTFIYVFFFFFHVYISILVSFNCPLPTESFLIFLDSGYRFIAECVMDLMVPTTQKFGVGKVFSNEWSLIMLTKATFFWIKM